MPSTSASNDFNPELDLKIERMVDLPPEALWRVWTEPDLLKQGFCPKPWVVTECRIDLRPGGEFFTIMKGPEAGQEFANKGCYLEIVKNRRLVWTDALTTDYRPAEKPFMTAILNFEPQGNGTKYTAIAKHTSLESRQQHESMGFVQGWNIVMDQLIEIMKRIQK